MFILAFIVRLSISVLQLQVNTIVTNGLQVNWKKYELKANKLICSGHI